MQPTHGDTCRPIVQRVVTEEERLAIIEQYPPPWPFVPYDPSQDPDEIMARILEEGP